MKGQHKKDCVCPQCIQSEAEAWQRIDATYPEEQFVEFV